MTDTLRTRIAKVLHGLYGPSLGAAEGGWDREPGGIRDMYLADADAIIRELGLTRVVRSERVPIHRYVTEWQPDTPNE